MAAAIDLMESADILYVLHRVGVEHEEVRPFSGFKGSPVRLDSERAGRGLAARSERFQRSQTGFDIEIHFDRDAEPGKSPHVRPESHGNSRAVQTQDVFAQIRKVTGHVLKIRISPEIPFGISR